MNVLLEYYKNMWTNTEVAQKYWQCGANDFGNLLWFMNTNFRTISKAFYNAYDLLKNEVGHKASEFEIVASHGQTKVKQHTVRMRQMWFYYLDTEDRYRCSKRGKVFESAMLGNTFTEAEKDLICYFFLLAAEFDNTCKYISQRTNEMFRYYHNAGFSIQEILDWQKAFIVNSQKDGVSISDCAKDDYFYIANLYRPYRSTDFLVEFHNASASDRDELKRYVQNNITNHSISCILSKKYETSGNFNKPMIVECAWIFYITKKLNLQGKVSYDHFVSSILSFYSELFYIDIEKVRNFILSHSDVFENIYNIMYDVNHTQEMGLLTESEIEEMGVIDPTDVQGQAQQDQVSETYKQMAKERSNYRCILEDSESCADHYFTSKKENQNYMEVHHFIPREFASEFEHTIEILDNYVTLCPCCHRKIHHAVDRERKSMIMTIYNKRKDLLEQHGLHITSPKQVLKFYKFDAENV